MPLTYLPAEAAFTSTLDWYYGYPSSNCVDRDLDTFCHVYWESDPSVTYDFEAPQQIESVAVHNRRQCAWCLSDLGHHTVSYRLERADNWTVCSEMTAPASEGPFWHACAHLVREIKVELPGSYRTLGLAEVEVGRDGDDGDHGLLNMSTGR